MIQKEHHFEQSTHPVAVDQEWCEREWDGVGLLRDFPETNNLHDLLISASHLIEGAGEVVCEVRVNGVVLSEEDEKRFEYSPTSQISNLKIRSQNPLILLDKSLATCRTYIDQMMPAI